MRILLFLIVVVLFIPACGKKGALIYPDMLVPAAPADVAVHQVGPGMRLAFTLPDKDKAGQGLTALAGVRVLRRETVPGQDAGCSSCANDFQLFKTIYVDHLDASAQRYGRFFMLQDSDVIADREYSYKILAFTKGNVDGDVSKAVAATMVKALLPPVLLALPAPTEIKLEFGSTAPLEGSLAGYNLYRSIKGKVLPFIPLNKEPIAVNSFIDSGLERGVTYTYAARMVVRLQKGEIVESLLSNEVNAGLSEDE